MFSNTPINDLHHALAHAQYQGFPEIEYEDRDWEHYSKTKKDKRIKKTRLHNPHDIAVFAMFTQTWSSTALGFGGIGGQAITSAYTIVLESEYGEGFCVYFGGRFAYRIQRPTEAFFDDVIHRKIVAVKEAHSRYEKNES